MSKNRRKFIGIIISMLLCFGMGAFFEYAYTYAYSPVYKSSLFKKALDRKERKADGTLDAIRHVFTNGNLDSIKNIDFGDDDIAYYLFVDNSLVFWSDNAYDVTSLPLDTLEDVQFFQMQNIYCVAKTVREGDAILLAVIKIKNNYSYENDYLQNDFAKGFPLGKDIVLKQGAATDRYAVFSESGTYLFSLANAKQNQNSPLSDYLSVLFWTMGISLFFLLFVRLELWFGKRVYVLRYYLISFAAFSLVTFVTLYFNFPKIVFSLDLFSPIYYGSGRYMSSLGHLVIITILLVVSISIFYFKVYFKLPRMRKPRKLFWLVAIQLFSLFFFFVIYWLFSDLIANSSFDIVFLRLQDVSVYSILSFLLIGVWFTVFILFRSKCVGVLRQLFDLRKVILSDVVVLLVLLLIGFFKNTYFVYVSLWYFGLCLMMNIVRYHSKKYFSYSALLIVVFSFSLFIVWHSFSKERIERNEKYRMMSERIFVNQNTSHDFLVESLLNKVDADIREDNNIKRYVELGDASNGKITKYLSKYYFQKVGASYELKSFICPKSTSEDCHLHYAEIYENCSRLDSSHFYNAYLASAPYDYLGAFDYVQYNGDTTTLYIELSSKVRTNYSYPNLLLASSGKSFPLRFSAAKYAGHHLQSRLGEYAYPLVDEWMPKKVEEAQLYKSNYLHYIYPQNDGTVVVLSERRFSEVWSFFLFLTYLFSFYFLICLVVYVLWRNANHILLQPTVFNRLIRSFIVFFVAGITMVFSVIVYFVINQTQKNYERERQFKVQYIKRSFYESFKDKNALLESLVETSFLLQDLSNTLETDIHLYDLNGEMVATSRPIVFISGFSSRLMNPTVYFSSLEDDCWMSESIGNLHYISSYSVLKNKEGKTLAYISVPTFESLRDLHIEIFNFLAIVINLYLILIFISILVSFLLARRIGLPIKSIEEKLKTIRIGKKNEKIEYKSIETDEIAQLIEQYNIMVDELAYSAEMLAKTERELAWKQMARQIAHEIKNPLTPMKLIIQQMQRMKKSDPEKFDVYFDKTVGSIIEQIENLSRIASEFSDFARMPEPKPFKMDLVERISSVVVFFRNNYDHSNIDFRTNVTKAFILADAVQITQIFNNLIKNAIQSIPSERAGEIRVSIYADEGWVIASVADNGVGIPEDVHQKMFLPNFTTKSSGMGLGLAIVKNMVNMSNGEISFTTEENEGTTFFVKFPLVQDSQPNESSLTGVE